MGLKFELLLVVLIAVTSVVTMSVKLHDQNRQVETKKLKELEFANTTFTEVTSQKREGVAFAVHGVRRAGILYVEKLRYHNDTIDSLTAERGRYEGRYIYLDGNVTLRQKDGMKYWTEHAYYDKTTSVLYATSPFVAIRGKSVFKGKTMAYDTVAQVLQAEGVDAIVYTEEK